ncbi:MAG: zeta toxin family protein [Rhodococcus sp. (in: high G+C Gram-positive bacteria)]|uniref:zeta toxin family protein n=1 Tax=Rhodococcus sp. TaxID=1831 RepID=UPI002ADAA15A|nr:zeta toxin family protein [Rhodococcus sp. (in: high G+C Gram-positive bacteria)]
MAHEAVEDRRARLESLSTPVGPLNIDAPLATVKDRRYFRTVAGELVPTSARRKLHAALLGRWRDSCQDLRSARRATVFAGPPAAGKSTLMGASNTHLADHRRIDADDFKTLLLRSAVEDGSIASLIPLPMRDNFEEQFHPLELSALVHRESTILQERALSDAMRAGENVAIDGTLGHMPWAKDLVRQLGDFGYRIHVIDVEAEQELSLARVVTRWRTGYEKAVAFPHDPDAALGGRWLPASAVTRLFPAGQARSVGEVNAREIAISVSSVVKYDLYRASAHTAAPSHKESWSRTRTGDWTSP